MVLIKGPSGNMVELVPVDFEETSAPWLTLKLSDGTVLKGKINVNAVARFDREFAPDGQPIYNVNHLVVWRVAHPGKGLTGVPTIKPQQGLDPGPQPGKVL